MAARELPVESRKLRHGDVQRVIVLDPPSCRFAHEATPGTIPRHRHESPRQSPLVSHRDGDARGLQIGHDADARPHRGAAVLFARSLWTTESESSTGSFARSHDRPAGDENSTLPFLGMTRTHRVRRSYDHRLRDAIAATGNADLFRDVAIPASTRRTWARGEVRPVVASVDVELEVYELLEQVDNLRQRAKVQAAIIGLLVRVLRFRRGNLDGDRLPDGETKSAVLRAIAKIRSTLNPAAGTTRDRRCRRTSRRQNG